MWFDTTLTDATQPWVTIYNEYFQQRETHQCHSVPFFLLEEPGDALRLLMAGVLTDISAFPVSGFAKKEGKQDTFTSPHARYSMQLICGKSHRTMPDLSALTVHWTGTER